MTWGYYLKMVWGVIPILLVYLDWQINQENQKLTCMLIFSITSGLLYPFSNKIMTKIGLLFARKEFWEKDFFTSATGGSLQAILFIFCFVFAIPMVLGFSAYKLAKHLARIGQVFVYSDFKCTIYLLHKFFINEDTDQCHHDGKTEDT